MSTNLIISLIVTLMLILMKMVFTAGFSALSNARKSVLRERAETGNRRLRRTLTLSEDATHLLATQQFLSMLLNLVIVVLITLQFWSELEDILLENGLNLNAARATAYLVFLPLLTALLMVTDRVATALVVGRAEAAAVVFTPLMKPIVRLFTPLVIMILKISGQMAVLLGGSAQTHFVTEEEIKTLVDAGSEGGVLEDEEKEMIYSVMRFGDTVAREVMVPRIDIVALDAEATLEEALGTIIQAGHSRIPVYEDTIDNIKGVLYAKDLLKVWQNGEHPEKLDHLLRTPHFVPESKSASELLIELQARKTHLVFVVDEYGGTAGLLTIEDLLEEIVGEIQDEYDLNEEALYEEVSETEYIFNARIDLDDFNDLLDVSISTDENDTLGGYIFSKLGRVPLVNDTFSEHGFEFKVLSVNGRRIRQVFVKKLEEIKALEGEEEKAPEENKALRSSISPDASTV